MEQRQLRIRKPRQANNKNKNQESVYKPPAPETKKPLEDEVASTPAESKHRLWSDMVEEAEENSEATSAVQVATWFVPPVKMPVREPKATVRTSMTTASSKAEPEWRVSQRQLEVKNRPKAATAVVASTPAESKPRLWSEVVGNADKTPKSGSPVQLDKRSVATVAVPVHEPKGIVGASMTTASSKPTRRFSQRQSEVNNGPKAAKDNVAPVSPTSEQKMQQTLKRGARQGGRDTKTKTWKNLEHEGRREPCKVNVHQEEKDSKPCKVNVHQEVKDSKPCKVNVHQEVKDSKPCKVNVHQEVKDSKPCKVNVHQEVKDSKPCKVNVHQEEKDSKLCKSHKYTLQQLHDARSALEAAQIQVQKLKRQQAEKDEHHLQELSQAGDDFRKELCEQDERFKNQLATQMERVEQELAHRREDQMQQLSRKEENNKKDLSEQEDRFKRKFADLEANMKRRLSELEESYRNVFSELEEKLNKKVVEEEDNLKQQLLEEEANLQSITQMEEEQRNEEESTQPQEVPMEETKKKKKGFWKGFWTRLFQRNK